MPHIVIDDDAVRTVAEARERVELRDRDGRVVGYVAPLFSEEDIAIARQRAESDEPRYTTAEVFEHLRSLEQR